MENKPVLKLARVQDMDLANKTVLVRVDYNVPLKEGVIKDDSRIRGTMKTVKYLLEKNCKVVLIAHLGRPKGKVDPKYTLEPLIGRVSELMGAKTHFGKDCAGPEAEKAVAGAKNGEIVLLENLRYHPEEEKNDEAFASQLAKLGEVFVQEAFGALHRAHASTSAITKFLPGCIGFLVQKELEFLDKAMQNPARPFLAIIGGSKVSDKIQVLYSLLEKTDSLIIGGAMAYTFLAAQSTNIGNSLFEEDKIEEAKKIILKAHEKNVELLLPADHRVVDAIENTSSVETTSSMAIPDGKIGIDIGPRTEAAFAEKIKTAKTIFWNGPVGIFETPEYSHGSVSIAEAVAQATAKGSISIIGGGDTVSALKTAKVDKSAVSHCSTGGGASLEFIEGKQLPGLIALSK
ncbi:MAG: phosphoglycerate kinase [Elusimicrobiales bacterium]|nr:phosphoglycerate kinase [Elusimicrobiales bacterium]